MCCGVVPIFFGCFLRVPSLHARVFIWKTFLMVKSVAGNLTLASKDQVVF